MDEATASIDIKTESIIQKSMDVLLRDCTVITIAHRIKTIIHYDKILVLANGEIAEFDEPEKLLEDQNSLFHELYKKSML
jgi:ABC-type multidrug transport system fused ATPase/permease subunit